MTPTTTYTQALVRIKELEKEESMELEGMTPEQAAEAIMQRHYQIGSTEGRIAAACQHFYERGLAEPIDPQSDVRAFMAAFGQAMPERPQWPDQQTMDLRVRLVAEEFCEWLRDSGYDYEVAIATPGDEGFNVFEDGWTYLSRTESLRQRSLPKSADALIDMLYVTIGSLLAMGIDMWPLWAEVQRANMAKAGGPVVDGKVRKPAGWEPPDIEALLRKQGLEVQDA